ncbi:hypothetical protein F5Y05DRAFT_410168 [Hypoxylon sp. FL0543]|nr:hypothetical protein F5Y05DRAFT_410168 [Hypoxylon sp. FL0543]
MEDTLHPIPRDGTNDVEPKSEACTILVPTSEGEVPIITNDEALCADYESAGRSFCSLPASFRDSWQHACPSSEPVLFSPDNTNTTADIAIAPPLVVGEPLAGGPGDESAAQLSSGTDSAVKQDPDLAPYYIGAASAFGAGIIVMCIIGCCMCRNRWGRRAREQSGW